MGYVVSVTGEGCGCVSVNVSTNTTSVTCSGWKVKGQTCVFGVRTITQCGLVSDRVVESVTLAVPLTPTQLLIKPNYKYTIFCDPAQLVNSWPWYNYSYPLNSTSFNDPGMIVIEHGVISFNGLTPGFTVRLTCDKGASPSGSIVRTCMDNGTWSGYNQYCLRLSNNSGTIQPPVGDTSLANVIILYSLAIPCLLVFTVTLVIILGYIFIYKTGYVSIKPPTGDIEQVLHSIENPQTVDNDAAEHTTVSSEGGSVNSDPTKSKCKDIVPGSSEEEIFGVVHASYKETHV